MGLSILQLEELNVRKCIQLEIATLGLTQTVQKLYEKSPYWEEMVENLIQLYPVLK